MRVMVLSHGHPDLIAGGGERAAYAIFQRLKRHPGVEETLFVAAAPAEAIGHSAAFGAFRSRPDEILACPPPVDSFTHQTLGLDQLRRLVDDLVSAFKPDVVHVHHFINWGLDVLELFRRAGVPVVFTFHEFGAICSHYGQMLKVDGRLCDAASPAECSLCFPQFAAGKFFVRESIVKYLLGFADGYLSPSAFLARRFTAWGIPEQRIAVVENLLDPHTLAQALALENAPAGTEGSGRPADRVVFSFFGQITPFKGVDLLLEAVRLLPSSLRSRILVQVHGDNIYYRETDFGRRLRSLAEEATDVVSLRGAYRNVETIALMAASDWIIVPSIWWENSPVVMQEARLAARPLICADIGGMSEKMNRDVDQPFSARSAASLADVMAAVVEARVRPDRERLRELARARVEADEAHLDRHVSVYAKAMAGWA
ncbi:MAG: glycosyltransferase [Microvirga sp.]